MKDKEDADITSLSFEEVALHSTCFFEMTYYSLNRGASMQLSFDFFVCRVLSCMRHLDWTFYSVTSIPLINVGAFNVFLAQDKYRIIETILQRIAIVRITGCRAAAENKTFTAREGCKPYSLISYFCSVPLLDQLFQKYKKKPLVFLFLSQFSV